jgi:ISXO2 transposase-like protein
VRCTSMRGLAEHEVARFVELSAGTKAPAGLLTAIHNRTGGNPFYVERVAPRGFGRCRMAVLADASADSLRVDHVQDGATVITGGWPSYPAATRELDVHDRLVAPGVEAVKLLPGVHTVSSLAKRWLLGTHQGTVDDAHLASYLNEFVLRFNRRRSRSRGLVFYRVLALADLIADPRPGTAPRTPPGTPRPPAEPGAPARRTTVAVRSNGYPSAGFSMREEGSNPRHADYDSASSLGAKRERPANNHFLTTQ